MAGGIPHQAIGAAVGVLMYSIICLILCFLVFCLLLNFGERWTYIVFLAFFASLSTSASIIQQIHYVVAWEEVKQAAFDRAVDSIQTPSLAVGGAAEKTDVVLFRIQFYCYNVMSLIALFWAISLFCGIWGIRNQWLGMLREKISLISKVFMISWPGLITGLQSAKPVIDNPRLFFLITYITICLSMSAGSVLLILILYKYMKTRRLATRGTRQGRGRWWGSGGNRSGSSQTTDSGGTPGLHSDSTARSIYDRALIIRFSIGFVIMALFEVSMVVFSIFQSNNKKKIFRSGEADLSTKGAISDIIFFIPGVTVSLVVFLVFGTSKSWRQYRELIMGGCGLRKALERRQKVAQEQDLEFARLPSLSSKSIEMAAKGREIERRVRMFSPSPSKMAFTRNSVESTTGPFETFSSNVNPEMHDTPRHQQFHKPLPAIEGGGIRIERSISIERSDLQTDYPSSRSVDVPVIQFTGKVFGEENRNSGHVIGFLNEARGKVSRDRIPISKFNK